MSEHDELAGFNPLLRPIVEAVTVAMAGAFDAIWSRPDAVALADGFLEGTVVFEVDRSGVLIVERTTNQVS
jgi:hypothetical protein